MTGNGPGASVPPMKLVIGFLLWCVLLVLCWPLAILAILILPLLWLLSIPFRLFAYVLESMLCLIKALLMLPVRVLGGR